MPGQVVESTSAPNVRRGRPVTTGRTTTTVGVRLPLGLARELERRALKAGHSPSSFVLRPGHPGAGVAAAAGTGDTAAGGEVAPEIPPSRLEKALTSPA